MPKAHLTQQGLISLKPPEKGQVEFWDTTLPAFGIRISQGGSKTFILKRENRRITLGRYPVLSLHDARSEAKRMMAEFTLGRLRPHAISYVHATAAFLEEKQPNLRPNTLRSYRRHLTFFTFGRLSQISQHDITPQLKPLAKTPSEHNHAAQTLVIFFGWCIKRQYLTTNPALHLPQFPKVSRSRVLTDAELKSIWLACSLEPAIREDAEPFTSQGLANLPRALPANFCTLVKLLILMGQRVTETASLQTSWIKQSSSETPTSSSNALNASKVNSSPTSSVFSNDLWTITIPKEVTKNKREHTFPIGTLTQALLPTSTGLLFPANGSTTHYKSWSKGKVALDKLSGVQNWTLHDLRRTFATRLADIGTAPHIIERLLNHATGTISGISATYNRAKYLPEMQLAVLAYESHLKQLLNIA